MNVLRLDWHADSTLYMLIIFIVCVMVMVLLERAAPRGGKSPHKKVTGSKKPVESDLIP